MSFKILVPLQTIPLLESNTGKCLITFAKKAHSICSNNQTHFTSE